MYQQQAKLIADTWNLEFETHPSEPLGLVLNDTELVLKSFTRKDMGEVKVDFASPSLAYRIKQGGGKKEPLIRAVGLHKKSDLYIVDGTAGLGVDGFMLAANGANVRLLERHPIVAALLSDGLTRAHNDAAAPIWIRDRLSLKQGPSAQLLAEWDDQQPDVVYLDPMFPHRKKSALVKKEMQLFQQLLGPDDDADELLAPAMKVAQQRVVVKRPMSAPNLANSKPDHTITSKKHRFDVYLTQ
jgi:16S rRNA (guanine1516-N2)-methyltransferase